MRNMEFSSLFSEFFTVYQICFLLSIICLALLSRAISYIISLYHVTLIWHGVVVQWADKSRIYIFSKEAPSLWQIRYFNSILGSKKQHICLFWDFRDLIFCFKFCVMLRYQWTAKVNQKFKNFKKSFFKNVFFQISFCLCSFIYLPGC